MNDKELLELAAKAAGLKHCHYSERSSLGHGIHHSEGIWNPLTEDGDALRLAVKLHIDLDQYAESIRCKKSADFDDTDDLDDAWENFNTDPYAATRRAIVRAAAEIGKDAE